jgi:hypothetical protein
MKQYQLQKPPQWQTRLDLPRILNELGLTEHGAEIGVQRGLYSAHLRRHWAGSVLHCVDPWRPYGGVKDSADKHASYHQDAIANLDAACESSEHHGGYIIHRTTSSDFAEEMAEHGEPVFDFVCLDGDHDEEPFRRDIEAFWPLIVPGGILAGHDYVPNGYVVHDQPHKGYATEKEALAIGPCTPFYVKKVVDELFPAEMVSLTLPDADGAWRSWMVRKVSE